MSRFELKPIFCGKMGFAGSCIRTRSSPNLNLSPLENRLTSYRLATVFYASLAYRAEFLGFIIVIWIVWLMSSPARLAATHLCKYLSHTRPQHHSTNFSLEPAKLTSRAKPRHSDTVRFGSVNWALSLLPHQPLPIQFYRPWVGMMRVSTRE